MTRATHRPKPTRTSSDQMYGPTLAPGVAPFFGMQRHPLVETRTQPAGSDRPPGIGLEGRRIRLCARATGLKDAGQGSCALRNDHVTKDRIDGRGAIGAGHDTALLGPRRRYPGADTRSLDGAAARRTAGRGGRAKDSVSVSRLFICRYSLLFSDRPASSDATRRQAAGRPTNARPPAPEPANAPKHCALTGSNPTHK